MSKTILRHTLIKKCRQHELVDHYWISIFLSFSFYIQFVSFLYHGQDIKSNTGYPIKNNSCIPFASTWVVKAVPNPVKQMSKTILRHTLIKKYFRHFCWLPYLYTFSHCENASFIIVSAEPVLNPCAGNIYFLSFPFYIQFVSFLYHEQDIKSNTGYPIKNKSYIPFASTWV
jgi:hypothetical protein